MADRKEISAGIDALLGGGVPAPRPRQVPQETVPPARENPKNLGHGGRSPIKNRYPTSLMVDRDKYDKVKQIAVNNGLNINEVVDAAFELFVEEYEKRHGEITSRESRISARDLVRPGKRKSHTDSV